MFTEVFLATTDPNLTFSQVFRSRLFVYTLEHLNPDNFMLFQI